MRQSFSSDELEMLAWLFMTLQDEGYVIESALEHTDQGDPMFFLLDDTGEAVYCIARSDSQYHLTGREGTLLMSPTDDLDSVLAWLTEAHAEQGAA